jgi:hypothetical protein
MIPDAVLADSSSVTLEVSSPSVRSRESERWRR